MRNKVKQVRKQRKITQKQLEEMSGIKQPEISEIENNRRSPSLNILEKIANGLNCKVSDLLEE